MKHFLEANHVTKRFGNFTALDDVSISLTEGKIFGLLGPNGAGKTTLIRAINHITMPDSGEVLFDGHPLSGDDVLRIGYLPEERGLYKKMKVGDQALYLARLKGLSSAEARRRLQFWFDKFDIMSWWNRKLEELSKGMQQKVQFITTVLHEPPLLIFDEPFSGFDPVNADILKNEILALKAKGHTILFSTHNMESVEELCDEIALINKGKVVLNGDIHSIKQQFKEGTYYVTIAQDAALVPHKSFELIDKTVEPDRVRVKLKKAPTSTNSEMLTAIAAQTEVYEFSECIPSMHDIFVKKVGADTSKD